MTDEIERDLHENRGRAESFGGAAEAYDRFRPDVPPALFDDIAAVGDRALDVGCGTGKVARGLAARGVRVLGVELDARMAALARGRGTEVEVARFEDWDARGRVFDVLACGDAWHWIDPARGGAKAGEVVRAGGAVVAAWNNQLLDGDVMARLDPIYAAHAPDAFTYGRLPKNAPPPPPILGPFGPAEVREYRWERRATADEWIGLLGTLSDHLRLGAARLAVLQAAVRGVLGDVVAVRGVTTAVIARRR